MNTHLRDRHESEKLFHDEKFSINHKQSYYDSGFTTPILEKMMQKVGNIEGLNVLEYGCGTGWFTKRLAVMGAYVWSFDISIEAVNRTNDLLKEENLDRHVHIEQMAGEELKYDSNQFDLVIGSAILHHLDLNLSLNEIKRVLKIGGNAYFLEPLRHNPLINFYRKMTPHLRSADELPLSFEQFDQIKTIFPYFSHNEYYFTTLFAVLFHFFGAPGLMNRSRDMFIRFDHKLLDRIPSLNRYCWYSLLQFGK